MPSGSRRLTAGVSLLIALIAAVWSVDQISLLPPRLTPRAVEIASAHTSVIVDTPKSVIVDLRQGTYNLQSLDNRAIVLGNIMASLPVLEYVAQRVHVPVGVISVAAPATPTQPAPIEIAGHPKSISDIARYSNQYRLSIEANPTAPVLDIYSQGPTLAIARQLADTAVDGLRTYMAGLSAAKHVPPGDQLRLTQLGRAQGGIVNPGAQWQLAAVAFILVLLLTSAVITFGRRLRVRPAAGRPAGAEDSLV